MGIHPMDTIHFGYPQIHLHFLYKKTFPGLFFQIFSFTSQSLISRLKEGCLEKVFHLHSLGKVLFLCKNFFPLNFERKSRLVEMLEVLISPLSVDSQLLFIISAIAIASIVLQKFCFANILKAPENSKFGELSIVRFKSGISISCVHRE